MISLNKLEKRTIYIAIIALLIFILTRLLHYTISFIYDPSYFLILHTLLESFSIFVSFSIFFHGWISFQYTRSVHKLNLSLTFLAVGSLDLLHTLSYKGMPFLQSEHTVSIATWFWIIGRFVECIGLSYYIIKNNEDKITDKQKNRKIITTLLLLGLISYIILSYSQYLPVLVHDSIGITNTKVMLEYIISIVHFITMLIIIRHYVQKHNPYYLTVFSGVFFLLIGELVFTLYHNVYDVDNLLGHVYKFFGYIYLFKGIFFPQFKQLFDDREKSEFKLQLCEEQLREYKSKVTSKILKAQEEERMNVSRNLHDGVGQWLYSILVSLKMLKEISLDEKINTQIENIEKLTNNAMDEVKNIAFQLRPSSLDDLGLMSAMRSHVERFEETFKIKVELEFNGKKERFASDIETALYRIFQEALNNAAKYSGTDRIYVRLINTGSTVEIHIIDEGKGFAVEEFQGTNIPKGIGLYSMNERAMLVNGKVEIESVEGVGTKIKVTIPIQKNHNQS